MTVSVIGASGLIGRRLLPQLQRLMAAEGTYFNNNFPGGTALDITNPVALRAYIALRRPSEIIWLSGTKDVPRCEKDADYAFKQNTDPIKSLIQAVAETGGTSRILFFSTDYVFDGARGRYCDNDVCSPHTNYGKSNLAAEDLLRRSGLPHVTIRTSAVMTRDGGFLGWLLGRLVGREHTALYENVYFSPTPLTTLARGVEAILAAAGHYDGQIVHIAGKRTNRYEFAQQICGILGLDDTLLVPERLDLASSSMQADLSLLPSEAVTNVCNSWSEDLSKDLHS